MPQWKLDFNVNYSIYGHFEDIDEDFALLIIIIDEDFAAILLENVHFKPIYLRCSFILSLFLEIKPINSHVYAIGKPADRHRRFCSPNTHIRW